jgi:hypothetical protein
MHSCCLPCFLEQSFPTSNTIGSFCSVCSTGPLTHRPKMTPGSSLLFRRANRSLQSL